MKENNSINVVITVNKTEQDVYSSNIKKGEYFTYKGRVYAFEGYEYGTYPFARDVETDQQIKLPNY